MSGTLYGDVIPSSRYTAPAGGVESGTKMTFRQTSAPTGWTKITGSGNDTALRLTTGTVGTGGSVAFETAFASQTIASHTVSTAELPAHTHTYVKIAMTSRTDGGSDWAAGSQAGIASGSTGGGGSHGHGSIDLNVSFIDVIIATKD